MTTIAAYDTTVLNAQNDLMHPTSICNPMVDENIHLTSSL